MSRGRTLSDESIVLADGFGSHFAETMGRPRTPLLAVDVIIELVDRSDRPIVLVERRHPPFGWALPGGFVDIGERLEQAAAREAKEETCLDVTLRRLLGCYSDPGRDPRSHTVSVVYVAESRGQPQAADDAENLGVFSPDALPAPLAFDHAVILSDYCRFRETGEPTSVTPSADEPSDR